MSKAIQEIIFIISIIVSISIMLIVIYSDINNIKLHAIQIYDDGWCAGVANGHQTLTDEKGNIAEFRYLILRRCLK